MANLFHSSAAALVASIVWISCHQTSRFKTQTGGQRKAWNLKPQQILDGEDASCYIFVFFIAWAVCCQPACNGWLVWETWVWQFYLVSIFVLENQVWNSYHKAADILIDPAVLGSCSTVYLRILSTCSLFCWMNKNATRSTFLHLETVHAGSGRLVVPLFCGA